MARAISRVARWSMQCSGTADAIAAIATSGSERTQRPKSRIRVLAPDELTCPANRFKMAKRGEACRIPHMTGCCAVAACSAPTSSTTAAMSRWPGTTSTSLRSGARRNRRTNLRATLSRRCGQAKSKGAYKIIRCGNQLRRVEAITWTRLRISVSVTLKATRTTLTYDPVALKFLELNSVGKPNPRLARSAPQGGKSITYRNARALVNA
jgi:hypothetical protein